jgi:large-conductance mechanosensitive channel
MMVFTHVLIGALFGLVIGQFVPDYTTILICTGMSGGLIPDLDMFLAHRKTLHSPVYVPVLSIGAGCLVVHSPSLLTIGLVTFLGAAGLHSCMDVFSGGRELRPWEEVDDRAVFNHYEGRWIPARRLVYSGSLADFGMSLLAFGVVVVHAEGVVVTIAFSTLVLSALYTLFQRRIAAYILRDFQTLSQFLKYQLIRRVNQMAAIVRR